MWTQLLSEPRLLGELEPELGRLERHLLVLVLRRVQHVLDEVVHLRRELLGPRPKHKHQRTAHRLAHDRPLVACARKECTDVGIDVRGHRRAADLDKLVQAVECMHAAARVRMRRRRKQLGNEHVERTHAIDLTRVKSLRHVLADFGKGAQRSLDLVEVRRVHRLRERREAINPVLRLHNLHQHRDNLRSHVPQHRVGERERRQHVGLHVSKRVRRHARRIKKQMVFR